MDQDGYRNCIAGSKHRAGRIFKGDVLREGFEPAGEGMALQNDGPAVSYDVPPLSEKSRAVMKLLAASGPMTRPRLGIMLNL